MESIIYLQPNYPEGGKRPMSHTSPLVAHSKDRPCGLRFAVGGAGSQFIPAGQCKTNAYMWYVYTL